MCGVDCVLQKLSIPFISGFYFYNVENRGTGGGNLSIPFISGFYFYDGRCGTFTIVKTLNPFYFRVLFLRPLVSISNVLWPLNPFYFRVLFLHEYEQRQHRVFLSIPFISGFYFYGGRRDIHHYGRPLNPFYFRVLFLQQPGLAYVHGIHEIGWKFRTP